MDQDLSAEKQVASAFMAALCPQEQDVVEDGFDALAARGFHVREGVPEHGFQIPAEVWSYGLALCTFVGGVLSGAAKDALKKRLADLLVRATEPQKQLSSAEIETLTASVETEGARLGIPSPYRSELQRDLRRVLVERKGSVLLAATK